MAVSSFRPVALRHRLSPGLPLSIGYIYEGSCAGFSAFVQFSKKEMTWLIVSQAKGLTKLFSFFGGLAIVAAFAAVDP